MLEHLHRRTNHINKAMRDIEAQHNKILAEQQQKISQIHQQAQELVYYYRKINLRERPDHGKPLSFENDHDINVALEKQDSNAQNLNATTQVRLQAVGKA